MAKNLFQPGHNKPGPGRPKGSGSHIAWCEDYSDGEGKDRLIELARSKNEKVAIQALTLIFAYGKGKPKESYDVDLSGQIDIIEVVRKSRQERGLD